MRIPALILAALLALAPGAALACGLPLGAELSGERALLMIDGERHQLITSVDLERAGPGAAVIFPVPGLPEVDQPPGGADLFSYLAEATRPLVRTETRVVLSLSPDGSAVGGAPPAGAGLLGREQLGAYDVARLAADDAGALQAWLDANGYEVPAAARPILGDYVAEGWSFVAVRFAEQPGDGSLAPLRISYRAAAPLYPLRLSALAAGPVTMDLYVVGAGRVEHPIAATYYAGPVAELDPPPAPELAALLGGAYLTHLHISAGPAQLGEDLRIQAAPDDQPFQREQVVVREIPIYRSLACWMALLFFASTMAIVASVAIRRRLDAISPDPR